MITATVHLTATVQGATAATAAGILAPGALEIVHTTGSDAPIATAAAWLRKTSVQMLNTLHQCGGRLSFTKPLGASGPPYMITFNIQLDANNNNQ